MKYDYDDDFAVTSVKKGGGGRKSGGEKKKGDKKGNAPTCYSSKHVRKQLAQQETKLGKKIY